MLEFTSQRKRMSVIVRDLQTNKIILMSKGADSIIEALLNENQAENLSQIMHFVSEFANEGLRTLLLAQKEIDEEYYASWAQDYYDAATALDDRE